MKSTQILRLLAVAALLAGAAHSASADTVDVSLNVFPANLANPNSGGDWQLVAKTDAPFGIAAVVAYVKNVNFAGITMETDIGGIFPQGEQPIINRGTLVELVYGQALDHTLVVGVGTFLQSDGPDPLGDPAWGSATLLFTGTYSSVVPMFTTLQQHETDANVLASTLPNTAALDADVTAVVRVAVPEPATMALAALGAVALMAARRAQSSTLSDRVAGPERAWSVANG